MHVRMARLNLETAELMARQHFTCMSGGKSAISVLPADLWARIFHTLQTSRVFRTPALDFGGMETKCNRSDTMLPFTCRLFRQVFQRNTRLFAYLHLKKGLTHAATASLLSWLHSYGKYVHTLVSSCGSPNAELSLQAVCDVAAKLTATVVSATIHRALSVL